LWYPTLLGKHVHQSHIELASYQPSLEPLARDEVEDGGALSRLRWSRCRKKLVVVCICISGETAKPRKETRTFSTMTADLLALSAWLTECGVTHIAMESTGEFTPPLMLPKKC
jgi:hypothetical protein